MVRPNFLVFFRENGQKFTSFSRVLKINFTCVILLFVLQFFVVKYISILRPAGPQNRTFEISPTRRNFEGRKIGYTPIFRAEMCPTRPHFGLEIWIYTTQISERNRGLHGLDFEGRNCLYTRQFRESWF